LTMCWGEVDKEKINKALAVGTSPRKATITLADASAHPLNE
jgi:hypothetical protein